jgi:hypothetical protein
MTFEKPNLEHRAQDRVAVGPYPRQRRRIESRGARPSTESTREWLINHPYERFQCEKRKKWSSALLLVDKIKSKLYNGIWI